MSDALTPAERIRALAVQKADRDALQAEYKACKDVLRAEGWSETDLRELAELLTIDLDVTGPGVPRAFPMTPDERRAGWRAWFRAYLCADLMAGVQARIEQRIADEKAAA